MHFNSDQSKENLPTLKDILEQLKLEDTQLQSVALQAFSVLVDETQEPLNPGDIDKLVEFLKEELSKSDYSLHTDLLKTAVIIAEKIHPNYIKKLLPIMVSELDEKNRFKSKIIIDMFANLSKNADSYIQLHLHAIIRKTPKLINFPYLRPVLEDFFTIMTKNDDENIYKDEINEALSRFPPELEDFTSSLQDKLQQIVRHRV
ncbi:MAG: hypothetical protein JW776_12000 [Candidatus Lokiarchaeota archaeon]|nr:hypothetical protein [Candidatus Lokiarchaeota archaeon]